MSLEKPSKKRKLTLETAVAVEAEEPEQAADIEPDEDTPVLSHKEARKQKRKAATLSGPANTSKPSTTSASKPEQAKRSQYGVWVGNLNFKTEASQLRNWFASCGEITRCNMPAGKGKFDKNRGFAYIDFETKEAAEAAVAKSENLLEGRKLLIKLSNDYQGRPDQSAENAKTANAMLAEMAKTTGTGEVQSLSKSARKIAEKQKNAVGPTLFIGNLGFETTSDKIKTMFDAHYRATLKWQPQAISDQARKRRKLKAKRLAENGSDTSSSSEDEESADEESEASGSGSESEDSDDSDTEEEKAKKAAVGKGEKSSLSGAGIRKVRLGTFQDSGKCKGWAFVDFHTPKHATLALLNPHNHRLDGRELVVEYASAEAVRRGGGSGGQRSAGNKSKAPAAEEKPLPLSEIKLEDLSAPAPKKHKPTQEERQAAREAKRNTQKKEALQSKRGKKVAPGAALAGQPRASTGIVEGVKGNKITFD